MVSVYDFKDYKEFFNKWVSSQPKNGHGEYRRVSIKLGISTTMVSQIFKGDKQLSLELSLELADYIGLNEEETDFFILLVEFAKAGSHKLQNKFLGQIKKRQEKVKKIENRIKKEFELSEEAKAIFYSSWIYSGVRLLTAVKGYQDASSIAKKLGLPRPVIQRVVDFLIQNRLVEVKKDLLVASDLSTHIGSSNMLVLKHHQNWRLQGFQKMNFNEESDLFYTGPTALSKEASQEIRNMILKFIESFRKTAGPSDSEETHCLNIDWFEY
jgi:uncharacterized protein (TIGR02147 family)